MATITMMNMMAMMTMMTMMTMIQSIQAETANEKEFLLNRLHQLLDQERMQVAGR